MPQPPKVSRPSSTSTYPTTLTLNRRADTDATDAAFRLRKNAQQKEVDRQPRLKGRLTRLISLVPIHWASSNTICANQTHFLGLFRYALS